MRASCVRLLLLLAVAASPAPALRAHPWLSACDLEARPGGDPAALRAQAAASCRAGGAALAATRLRHCRERALLPALGPRARRQLRDPRACQAAVLDVLRLDLLAGDVARGLGHILARYDCGQTFSVIHSCEDCQEAYRKWVCSSLVPLYITKAALQNPGQLWQGEELDPETVPQDDAPKIARRARTAYSIDTYSGYSSNGKNTKLNNNNNNNYYNSNINEYDHLLLLMNDNRDSFEGAGVAYYDDDYESDRPADDGSASFYTSDSSNSTYYDVFAAWGMNGSRHSKTGDARPEHKMVEARKDLDNRLARKVLDNRLTRKSLDNRLVRKQLNPSGGARSRREDQHEDSNQHEDSDQLFRIKPCLSVCQNVEQACPYFLPGDRAPSYPTQYAGEPTFLCLDSKIEEVGEQLNKSNYGIPECCYTHCERDSKKLCHYCSVLPPQNQPYASDCGTSSLGSISSASVSQASSSVIIILLISLTIFNSAYNKIVLFKRWNANYHKPVNFLTFDIVYYCIKKIMKIIPSTRL